jgi:hypothetical protein
MFPDIFDMNIFTFFFFWYVELMPTVCLHPSVTLCIDPSGRMVINDKQEILWKEAVMVTRKVLSQNLPEGIAENNENIRIFGAKPRFQSGNVHIRVRSNMASADFPEDTIISSQP